MSRPTKEATISGENRKCIGKPCPYMDEEYLWNLLIIYEGQAFQDGLVHLPLKVDELIVEVSSIFTEDGRVHRPVQPR